MSQSPPATTTTAAELPVRAVTLSNAGLVQIERAGELAPDAAVAFRAPAEDVDDLLKSLVLRDPEGEVEGVRLPAQDLEVEAFRGLPLDPADFTSRWSLLQALRGQEAARRWRRAAPPGASPARRRPRRGCASDW